MGRPELAGFALGGADIRVADSALERTRVQQAASPDGSPQCDPPVWPSPSTPADAEPTRVSNVVALRCRDCDAADFDGGVVRVARATGESTHLRHLPEARLQIEYLHRDAGGCVRRGELAWGTA